MTLIERTIDIELEFAEIADGFDGRTDQIGLTEVTDWKALAACQSVPNATDLFFSEETPEIAQAKMICAECPVIAECLEGALVRAEPVGVWGGQLFVNGKVVAEKRRRGRPRKVARPEDQLPEIPVPVHLQALIS